MHIRTPVVPSAARLPRIFRSLALLSAAALLSACAATVQRPNAAPVDPVAINGDVGQVVLVVEGSDTARAQEDWAEFRALWNDAIRASATAAGIQGSVRDSRPASLDPSGVVVVVRVDSYRYVSTGARYGLGVMTGNAHIKANAQFIEVPGGKVAATRTYDTTSSAWQGIFAPMTVKQVQAITDQIVAEARGG
ncbi:DUF4410 domain-containing protein [Luteimonas sp. 3794]|uniref:DUF4410 domain-containing protein n=1 Tax=Luteimonas sp. 3794 TaxID=2817730 RepID=UPI002864936C|nr:DUF4410 domain-containing protein [Luteimonas sp. 3794]MDR6992254.1 hypothetical protein [Luteimonas sp. 3794]